jgi:hypothetical protein
MKRFFAGALATVGVIGTGGVIWLALNQQSRGILMGVGVCTGGMFLGATMAMAVVGVLLLAKLTWGVNVSAPQPPQIVLHGGGRQQEPGLLPPAQYGPPPAAIRPPRQWDVLGADDVDPPGWG